MTIGIGDNGGGELIGIEKMNTGGLRIILTPFIDWTDNIILKSATPSQTSYLEWTWEKTGLKTEREIREARITANIPYTAWPDGQYIKALLIKLITGPDKNAPSTRPRTIHFTVAGKPKEISS